MDTASLEEIFSAYLEIYESLRLCVAHHLGFRRICCLKLISKLATIVIALALCYNGIQNKSVVLIALSLFIVAFSTLILLRIYSTAKTLEEDFQATVDEFDSASEHLMSLYLTKNGNSSFFKALKLLLALKTDYYPNKFSFNDYIRLVMCDGTVLVVNAISLIICKIFEACGFLSVVQILLFITLIVLVLEYLYQIVGKTFHEEKNKKLRKSFCEFKDFVCKKAKAEEQHKDSPSDLRNYEKHHSPTCESEDLNSEKLQKNGVEYTNILRGGRQERNEKAYMEKKILLEGKVERNLQFEIKEMHDEKYNNLGDFNSHEQSYKETEEGLEHAEKGFHTISEVHLQNTATSEESKQGDNLSSTIYTTCKNGVSNNDSNERKNIKNDNSNEDTETILNSYSSDDTSSHNGNLYEDSATDGIGIDNLTLSLNSDLENNVDTKERSMRNGSPEHKHSDNTQITKTKPREENTDIEEISSNGVYSTVDTNKSEYSTSLTNCFENNIVDDERSKQDASDENGNSSDIKPSRIRQQNLKEEDEYIKKVTLNGDSTSANENNFENLKPPQITKQNSKVEDIDNNKAASSNDDCTAADGSKDKNEFAPVSPPDQNDNSDNSMSSQITEQKSKEEDVGNNKAASSNDDCTAADGNKGEKEFAPVSYPDQNDNSDNSMSSQITEQKYKEEDTGNNKAASSNDDCTTADGNKDENGFATVSPPDQNDNSENLMSSQITEQKSKEEDVGDNKAASSNDDCIAADRSKDEKEFAPVCPPDQNDNSDNSMSSQITEQNYREEDIGHKAVSSNVNCTDVDRNKNENSFASLVENNNFGNLKPPQFTKQNSKMEDIGNNKAVSSNDDCTAADGNKDENGFATVSPPDQNDNSDNLMSSQITEQKSKEEDVGNNKAASSNDDCTAADRSKNEKEFAPVSYPDQNDNSDNSMSSQITEEKYKEEDIGNNKAASSNDDCTTADGNKDENGFATLSPSDQNDNSDILMSSQITEQKSKEEDVGNTKAASSNDDCTAADRSKDEKEFAPVSPPDQNDNSDNSMSSQITELKSKEEDIGNNKAASSNDDCTAADRSKNEKEFAPVSYPDQNDNSDNSMSSQITERKSKEEDIGNNKAVSSNVNCTYVDGSKDEKEFALVCPPDQNDNSDNLMSSQITELKSKEEDIGNNKAVSSNIDCTAVDENKDENSHAFLVENGNSDNLKPPQFTEQKPKDEYDGYNKKTPFNNNYRVVDGNKDENSFLPLNENNNSANLNFPQITKQMSEGNDDVDVREISLKGYFPAGDRNKDDDDNTPKSNIQFDLVCDRNKRGNMCSHQICKRTEISDQIIPSDKIECSGSTKRCIKNKEPHLNGSDGPSNLGFKLKNKRLRTELKEGEVHMRQGGFKFELNMEKDAEVSFDFSCTLKVQKRELLKNQCKKQTKIKFQNSVTPNKLR